MKLTALAQLSLLVAALASTFEARASECFTRTFCSTGAAPRYTSCSRGQDCSRAPDLGLQFKADCTLTRFLGDAIETLNYSLEGSQVTVQPRTPGSGESQVYLLQSRRGKLRSKENPQHVWAVSACKTRHAR